MSIRKQLKLRKEKNNEIKKKWKKQIKETKIR